MKQNNEGENFYFHFCYNLNINLKKERSIRKFNESADYKIKFLNVIASLYTKKVSIRNVNTKNTQFIISQKKKNPKNNMNRKCLG